MSKMGWVSLVIGSKLALAQVDLNWGISVCVRINELTMGDPKNSKAAFFREQTAATTISSAEHKTKRTTLSYTD